MKLSVLKHLLVISCSVSRFSDNPAVFKILSLSFVPANYLSKLFHTMKISETVLFKLCFTPIFYVTMAFSIDFHNKNDITNSSQLPTTTQGKNYWQIILVVLIYLSVYNSKDNSYLFFSLFYRCLQKTLPCLRWC